MTARLFLLATLAAVLAGCQSEPTGQAWNRPPKYELSRDWCRVWNAEADHHRQESPYP